MEKLKHLFHKWPLSYLGIFGCILYLSLFTISVVLYSKTASVNWTQLFVSNMGIGPNGAAFTFSLGLFVLGIMIYPFLINLAQQLWIPIEERAKFPRAQFINRLDVIAFIISIICVPGLFLIAFYSMAIETIVPHAVGAMTFFFGTLIYGTLFYFILKKN